MGQKATIKWYLGRVGSVAFGDAKDAKDSKITGWWDDSKDALCFFWLFRPGMWGQCHKFNDVPHWGGKDRCHMTSLLEGPGGAPNSTTGRFALAFWLWESHYNYIYTYIHIIMYDYMCISPPMSHFPSSFLESTRHVHTHTHMLIKSTVDPGFTRQLSRSFQSILQEDA